jgi:Na+-transporting methylmalonyl-CoA/oxaloacetate decarboxylase beta subunit
MVTQYDPLFNAHSRRCFDSYHYVIVSSHELCQTRMGGMMSGTAFLRPETTLAFMLGAIAFSPDTAAGVLLG